MAEAESLRQVVRSRAPLSAWLGTMLLFMLFGVIVLALIGPSVRKDNYEQTRAKKRFDNLKTLREEDAKTLTSYAWIDKAKGSARIPIDRAMQLTMAELAQKKPAPAGPIATPPPAPQTSPAASATSAAPAPAASNKPVPPASSTPVPENRSQPSGAANPPGAKPGSQPGVSATPQAAPPPPSGKPAVSPSATPSPAAPGSPLPVAGKTPPPTP